jgi:N-acetylglutamate synthase
MSEAALLAALEATWPAASLTACGPFTLRDGAGGGKRASAATLEGAFSEPALDVALERGARLFRVAGPGPLDAALERRGFAIVDPTVIYAAPAARIAAAPRAVSLLHCWPPIAMQRLLWAEAGTGPGRLAVMARAATPRTAFIARHRNRAAGVAFCALHEGIAMLHALEVIADFRREGVARNTVRGVAHWAMEQGAQTFALAVTRANAPARALYSALGMEQAGGYHYRSLP